MDILKVIKMSLRHSIDDIGQTQNPIDKRREQIFTKTIAGIDAGFITLRDIERLTLATHMIENDSTEKSFDRWPRNLRISRYRRSAIILTQMKFLSF